MATRCFSTPRRDAGSPRTCAGIPASSSPCRARSDPQAYAVFHGKARVTEAGADEHIDKLAKRFLGADKYPFRPPGEKRLLVRIDVDRIGGFGPGMKPWS